MTRALLGLAGVLLAVIGLELLVPWAGPDGAARPIAPNTAAPVASADGAVDEAAGWAAISLARPLFSPNRRPAALATGPADGTPRLSGILVTPAGRRAIFAGADGKPVVVGEGAAVGRYQVGSIAAGQVVLLGADGSRTLRPSFDPNRVVTTPPPTATPLLPAPFAPPPAPPAPGPGSLP